MTASSDVPHVNAMNSQVDRSESTPHVQSRRGDVGDKSSSSELELKLHHIVISVESITTTSAAS